MAMITLNIKFNDYNKIKIKLSDLNNTKYKIGWSLIDLTICKMKSWPVLKIGSLPQPEIPYL